MRQRGFPYLPVLLLLVLTVSLSAAESDAFRLVADFESGEAMQSVKASTSRVERVATGEDGHALKWSVPGTGDTHGISLSGAPSDVREFRYLRVRARLLGPTDDTVHIRLRSGEAVVTHALSGLSPDWSEIRIAIPEMNPLGGEFNPEKVDSIRLVVFRASGTNLLLDDVALVPAPGGWRYTEAERIRQVFGKKRVKKVKRRETEHFVLLTDSSAAGRKFPKALEEIHDFLAKTLDLEAPAGRIPAYVFQNASLYQDFCVRNGWTRDHARSTAGHASARYFSTYYQSTRAPVLVHEMAHSLFQRSVGAGGGSWFQEGVAVYAEHRWQKSSPAKVFASRLRSGQYAPLRDFFACPKLIAENDRRGGARTGAAMYLQAGAFYEFLVRGPIAGRRPDARRELATLDAAGEARVTAVERILGASSAEIEAEWVKWGSRPPKP